MATDLNINPYYDDFDDEKGYHQILFKPGYPVQARELTQMQTILRKQIERFGNHVFKHGSVVIPGNSNGDLNAQYVKINPTTYSIEDVEGKYVVGELTNIRAYVKKTVPATDTDPITFFVSYTNGGVNGELAFLDNETLTVEGTSIEFSAIGTEATGTGSMAFLNKGVFYVNGSFVYTPSQSVVIDKYSNTPSASVVLKIVESVVTTEEDQTLLDPAQGSYNFAAPGADRIKIQLILDTVPLGTEMNDDLIEIMRYNNGVLEEHARYASYAELEKNIARRTYDESGDYVVNGLTTDVREHLKTTSNGGVYSLEEGGDKDKFVAEITAGKAYIKGFEKEVLANRYIALDKGRTAEHVKVRNNTAVRPEFGQYLYVSNIVSLPNISERQVVNLYNDDTAGSQIGTARVVAIDYVEGDPATQYGVYKLYISDLTFTAGNIESIGSVRWTGGSMLVLQRLTVSNVIGDFAVDEIVAFNTNVRIGTVRRWDRPTSSLYIYKHDTVKGTPDVGDVIVGLTSAVSGNVNGKEVSVTSLQNSSIFQLPFDATRKVKDGNNVSNISYKVYKELLVTTGAGGTGSTSVSGMTIDPIEAGNIIIAGPTGVLSPSAASLNTAGTEITISGTANTTYRVVVSATKSGVAAKTKTLVRATRSFASPTTVLSLGKADIYQIVSVIDSTGDITNRYTLDDGQRDYAYLVGTLTLRGASPVGTVTVTFDYFDHGAAGDFFSADSYEITLGVDYLTKIPKYISKSDGTEYVLQNCLDFRPRQADDGTFTSASARKIDLVQPLSRITTSVQYYVPRIDTVYIDKSGVIAVAHGEPAENPITPSTPDTGLALSYIFVPAYTTSVVDINVVKAKNRVYTMADIGKLEDRVYNLEQFTLLSQSENTLVNYDVVDAATGLSRFKSGYLVETFENPDTISDLYNEEFRATYYDGKLIPFIERHESDLVLLGSSTNYVNRDNVMMLPYTQVLFASQTLSTRVTNINFFMLVRWEGEVKLTPSVDNWVETEYLPTIYQSQVNVTYVTVQRPWNWVPPAVRHITRAAWTWVAPPPPPPPPAAPARRSGKIICTELYNLGLMDYETYVADQRFGDKLSKTDPLVMDGYHSWAGIVVDWMRGKGPDMFFWITDPAEKARRTHEWSTKWAYEIATPWAEEMAYQMGVRNTPNHIGKALMSVGKVISKVVGVTSRFKRSNKKPGRLAGASCIVIFTALYAMIKVMKFFDSINNTANEKA